MKHSEKAAPLAAVFSALASISCCLPLGIPAAMGVAGVGLLLGRLRPWLIGISLLLLAAGAVQLYRKRSCDRRSRASLVIFWFATAVVLLLALFPRAVASILAGGLP